MARENWLKKLGKNPYYDVELFCVVLNSLNGITSCSLKISVLVFFCQRFNLIALLSNSESRFLSNPIQVCDASLFLLWSWFTSFSLQAIKSCGDLQSKHASQIQTTIGMKSTVFCVVVFFLILCK